MVKVIVLGILIISNLFANNIYKYDEVDIINGSILFIFSSQNQYPFASFFVETS
jgi:hypothetical protein